MSDFFGVQLAVDDLQNLARLRRHLPELDLPLEAVERHVVAFLDDLAVDGELLVLLGNLERAGADDGRLAHLTADDRRVRRHAAGRRQDALRDVHAVNVVRHRFLADENHLLALPRPLDGIIRGKDDLAGRSAGRRRKPFGEHRNLRPLGRIESRREQLRQRLGIDQQHRLLRRHDLLGGEIGGNHDGRVARALAAAGLQHVELLVLNGELEVLHVLVVLLEARGDLSQLLVSLRQHLLELPDRLRRAHAGDDVLALCVDQELAVELLRAGRRASGEADAGRRSIAGVAEHHLLHVDRGADVVGDVVDAAVFLRARILPGAEHRVARALELLDRILRKRLAGLLLHDLLVARDHFAQRRLVEVGIGFRAARFLHRVELVLEDVLRNLQHDVAEHLDEAAIAVGGEPAVAGLLLQRFDGLVVEAEIQNRVHHAGHRKFRARADRHEQRLLRVAQLAARRSSRASAGCRSSPSRSTRESCRLPCSRWCRRASRW